MELPQPRPYGPEGRKTTHDFLSLYSPSQQDPKPQGSFLKTHDFLQPLEQVGKDVAKVENRVEMKDVERPPPAVPPPPAVERTLPGGIGTYSITYFNPGIPKPEGNLFMMAQTSSTSRNDENSNGSSYSGSGFTLWDESAVQKGKTGKENNVVDRPVLTESVVNLGGGPWTTSSERPSQSSSSQKQNNTTFSSLSSPLPSSAPRNQSFMNMITSAKSVQEEDDDEEEEFVVKKEPTSHPKGNLTVKVDGKSNDQKPNTPRSKHSATEQRRRSKINDRFQKLREIIPHSDQKRDKASFLLEVIDYIQFLQEKVQKFEGSYPGWNQEPSKLIPWRNPRTAEDFINQTQPTNIGSGPALLLAAKFDESKSGATPVLPINGQHLVESDMSSAASLREKVRQHEITNKAAGVPVPVSVPLPLRTSIFPFGAASNTVLPPSSRPTADTEKPASQPQSLFWPTGSCTADSALFDKMKEQELTIESGTISISSIYSQGLLSSLTQALQTSGIDLSQANISVQIDLGKRANRRVNSSTSIAKNMDNPTSNQAMPRSIVTCTGEDSSGQALKRLKTSRS